MSKKKVRAGTDSELRQRLRGRLRRRRGVEEGLAVRGTCSSTRRRDERITERLGEEDRSGGWKAGDVERNGPKFPEGCEGMSVARNDRGLAGTARC